MFLDFLEKLGISEINMDNNQQIDVCGHDQFGRFWSFCLCLICYTGIVISKSEGYKRMSLYGWIIGKKLEREGVKGSHQWSSSVIYILTFFVQQLPGKGEKRWDVIVCQYIKVFRIARMRESIRNEVRKTFGYRVSGQIKIR